MINHNAEISIQDQILGLATDIVTAYVSNNIVSTDNLPSVISAVYDTLKSLDSPSRSAELHTPSLLYR